MTISIEQFNKLITRDEFNERMDNLEAKFATKDDINMILNAIDGFAKKTEISEQERFMNQSAHDRFQNKLDNHEVRINKLEKQTV